MQEKTQTQPVAVMAGMKTVEGLKGLVTRDKKVAFMECKNDEGHFNRMTNFTEMTKSSNPNEYKRKYMDKSSEDTDVTGYSPSISYAFDLYIGNKVHEEISGIADNEEIGDNALRTIIQVDFTKPVAMNEGQYHAIKRTYAVVPDSDGSDPNTYTYSGNFQSKSEKENIKVQTADNWQSVTVVME